MCPVGMKSPLETHLQEEMHRVRPYEITQNALKFKGNVKGVKIKATQVTSKEGQYTSGSHQSGDEEQKQQSKRYEKQEKGVVIQSGACFFKSVTDSDAEMNQSVGGRELYKVTQGAFEFEGDAIECTFTPNQRVW